PVPRHARRRPAPGRVEGPPPRGSPPPLALLRGADDSAPLAPEARLSRTDPRPPDLARRTPPAQELARRRGRLHHPAAGLHRGPLAAGPGEVEPRHVS